MRRECYQVSDGDRDPRLLIQDIGHSQGYHSVPRLCEKAAGKWVGNVDMGYAKIATLASTV